MEVENQNDDELRQLTQAKAAEMRSPDLNPQQVAASRFERIVASIEVAASKRGAAIAIINGHAGLIIAALRRCDYGGIAALLNSFDYAYRFAGLATPVVERSPRELYAGLFSRWGWGGEESDAAIARIKPRATVA